MTRQALRRRRFSARAAAGVALAAALLAAARQAGGAEPAGGGKIDARALVEALANRNPQPTLDHSYYPRLGPRYDWSENDRIWKAVTALIDHAEEAWPALVAHLGDDRYCLTVETLEGFVYNWSVSDICREIIGRDLSQAYFQAIPLYKLVYYRLRRPHFTRDKQKLKAWCEARCERVLYELQIEICQLVQPEVAAVQDDLHLSEGKRQQWREAIAAAVESLRRSKAAVRWTGFGHEELQPYRKSLEALRN
jgi:hypothetical protein